MTPAARLQTIIEIYDQIITTARPSDQVLQTYLRARKFIGSKDRKYIAALVYDLLRHYARLNWWIDTLNLSPNGRHILLLYLALCEKTDHTELAELFDGSSYGPQELSSREIAMLENISDHDLITPDMDEAVQTECSVWAYDALKQNFGNTYAMQMRAMQAEAPLDLRVNTLKGARGDVIVQLRQDGMDVQATPYAPNGIRVHGRPAFSAHPLYQNGVIEVQDEGSQILAQLCGVKPGEWLVDFCAGAGGKTMALAAMLENKGRIWACDIDTTRLENGRKRMRRAGVHCVEMKTLSNENDPWVKKHASKADCVLVDAPCSGVGTWRRNPFSRWQDLGPRLHEFLPLQQNILRSAARLVKPGGRLVYATCSMLPQENQQQIDSFLQNNKDFEPLSLKNMWPDMSGLDLSSHMLQLTPATHRTDGFFVAVMTRK